MRQVALRTFFGIAAAGVVVGFTSATVGAADKTASLAVAASVTNNCTISTTQLTFGAYDPVGVNASAELTSTGNVVVACTKGAAANIALGNGGGADANSRRLAYLTNYLPYQLYRADGQVWGSGAGAMSYSSESKTPTTLPVVGKIAGGADVPAGSYADTIVATVNF